MTISKADERWLACLDRALQYHAMKVYSPGDLAYPDVILQTATDFYRALMHDTHTTWSRPTDV